MLDVPAALDTVTSTEPDVPAGAVAVTEVPAGFTTTPVAAAVPKDTVAPGTKPEPASVTVVPPATGPASGETEMTVGDP